MSAGHLVTKPAGEQVTRSPDSS